MSTRLCYFNMLWLSQPDYRDWLAKESTHTATCNICEKTFDIGNMGESAIKSHSKGAKHKHLMQVHKSDQRSSLRITEYFGRPNSTPRRSTESSDVEQPMVPGTTPSRPSTIVEFATNEEVLKAEIIWALNVIECHHSYKSCEGIGALFRKMFPDSSIAAQFKCAEKKAAYLNVFGLAPHFSTLMKQKIDSKYVLLFDESLNKKNQKKQMDFYVRVWENDHVKSRYLDSKFVGHCTAEDMMEEFQSILKNLNPRNLIQVSMDGPSVNWKFHRTLQVDMETKYGKSLLDVGSCGLHICHGAFQTGVEKAGTGIANLLRALYTLFRDSPARREDYTGITDGAKVPLKFCKTRWLDNAPCAARAIDIWGNICKYVDEVKKKTITKPDNQSYLTVFKAVHDPLTLARLKFFLAVAQEITPFLTMYQSDQPLLPFITHDLLELIHDLLERFVDHKVTNDLTAAKLASFNVRDQKNFVDISKVDIGLAADKALKEARRTKNVSDRAVLEYRMECRTLLIELVGKLIEKCPIKYPLARSLACLDPRNFEEKDVAVKYMRRALGLLADANWITPETGDDVLRQYSRYLDDATLKHKHFDRKETRLDSLWHADISRKVEFSKLWAVVSLLLLLSHGQATVERGFSINKEVEVENMREESLIAQRIICDHLHNVGGVQNVELDKKILMSAKGARRRYQDYLDEQKRLKEQQPAMNKKRKMEEEVADMKLQQKRLKVDIDSLRKSADEFSMRAEKERDFTHITKANSLRTSAKRKEVELITFEEQLAEKTRQLKSL